MPLRLYNSLTRTLEDFQPADPGRVTFYSCGPTVYDDAHIGNFRSFLAADVLRRFLESPLCELANDQRPAGDRARGRTVVHIMNITDVGHMTDDASADGAGEDKMHVAAQRLLEAKKSGQLPPGVTLDPNDPAAIAGFYADRFLDDARRLGLRVALDARQHRERMPRATEMIEPMKKMIRTLIERGHAYVVGQPGSRVVYFDVPSFPAYGQLSGNTLDKLRTGAGGRISDANQSQKKHPADFMLWKEDASHVMKWDSPWGAGYPGWHIECSAMAAACIGDARGQIDLHSGGEDNIFPHHECEIAQSCGASGSTSFARAWFHARHLMVEGEKMSKSKGNFYTARQLFAEGVEPAALRLALIGTHYRSNANFTRQLLSDCQRTIERWRRFVEVGQAAGSGGDVVMRGLDVEDEFKKAMHDDLNVARAIAAINQWISTTSNPTIEDVRSMNMFDAVLGVLGLEKPRAASTEIGVYIPPAVPTPEIEGKLAARRDAKARKDFKASDALRDELAALGYAIKDVAGGKVEVSRK